jgi:hypothetical protein
VSSTVTIPDNGHTEAKLYLLHHQLTQPPNYYTYVWRPIDFLYPKTNICSEVLYYTYTIFHRTGLDLRRKMVVFEKWMKAVFVWNDCSVFMWLLYCHFYESYILFGRSRLCVLSLPLPKRTALHIHCCTMSCWLKCPASGPMVRVFCKISRRLACLVQYQ